MTEAFHTPRPSAEVEHFLAEAISNSPQPLKDLALFLSSALSEDDWKTADRLLLALALRTQAPDSWRPDREAVARVVKEWTDTQFPKGCRVGSGKWIEGLTNRITAALRPQTAESGK